MQNLEPFLGGRSRVSEIPNRKRSLSMSPKGVTKWTGLAFKVPYSDMPLREGLTTNNDPEL